MKKIVCGIALGLIVGRVLWAADAASLKTPNISGNALFLYRNSNFAQEDLDTERNGLDLQEAELSFYSNVDPYSRLNMLLTVHPEYDLNDTKDKVVQSWVVEPEELFAESDQVPGVTFKLGKFKAAFGKHNLLHTHAFPLVDQPIANQALLGDEGLNDVGLSAAILLPPTNWYSELTLQYLRGEGENTEFNSPTPGDGVGLAHFKNLFDLNDSATIEGGLSYAQGANSVRGTTQLFGADLTLKWRPVEGGKYRSGILGAEYIERRLSAPGVDDERGSGFNIWGQYQFAQRWAAVVRTEGLRIQDSNSSVDPDKILPNDTTTKHSVAVVFMATEFSSYKFEYDLAHGPPKNDMNDEHTVYLQANFTIGSHPAHAY